MLFVVIRLKQSEFISERLREESDDASTRGILSAVVSYLRN